MISNHNQQLKNQKRFTSSRRSQRSSSSPSPYTKSSTSEILLRVRGKDGTFRFRMKKDQETLGDIKQRLENETGIPSQSLILTRYPNPDPSDTNSHFKGDQNTLQTLGLQHGDMLEFHYNKQEYKSKQDAEEEKRQQIKEEEMKDDDIDHLGLKYRKKHWTLNEYLDLKEKVIIRIKHQKYAICSAAEIDSKAGQDFQFFLRQTAMKIPRVGWLYGTKAPGKKPQLSEEEEKRAQNSKDEYINDNEDYEEVYVKVIYEPTQQQKEQNKDTQNQEMQDEQKKSSSSHHNQQHHPQNNNQVKNKEEKNNNDEEEEEDKGTPLPVDIVENPYNERADTLANLLGLQKVGWIFSHDGQREYPLLNEEILKAAQYQSQYGPSFVTVTVSPNEEGEIVFEAFQVSKQCVELWEKGLLSADPNNPENIKCSKKVEVERKMTHDIDALLLVSNVAIKNHESIFQVGFPPRNRPGNEVLQSMAELKSILKERSGQKFVKRISDFHLLLFLTEYLSLDSDFPALCEAIRSQNNQMASGFEHLINLYCGLEQ